MIKLIFRITGLLILIFSIGFCIIYLHHPIIAKWVTGTAHIVGKPINASIYTDGRINKDISVFKNTGDSDGRSYLVVLKDGDSNVMLKYINIDLTNKWVGRSISSNSSDHDMIGGFLFQSETGDHFADFKDDMKGFNFDPRLTFANNVIAFNMPPKLARFNAVRIILPPV